MIKKPNLDSDGKVNLKKKQKRKLMILIHLIKIDDDGR